MMPSTAFVKPSTPVSTVSSVGTNNTANATTAVQSGPYTKAQFQNTMEGSRSVKNIKEVEQLLRDYPAALELYRTGRYKVKIKNEADIERVILVEKRTNKNTSNNVTKSNDVQQNNQPNPETSINVNKTKEDVTKERSRSRTHSRDHVTPTTPVTDNNTLVQATTSSIRMPSNAQPKVDHHRTPSKEHDVSVTSQSKQQQKQQQETHHRSHSHDNRSKLSHPKQKGKKNSHDYQNAIVPYANPAGNMWQQSRALQPYYSNPMLLQQPPMSNIYMPSPYAPQQNSIYQQSYYYGQRPFPALVYQKPSVYPPSSSSIKSTGNISNHNLPSTHNNPPSSQTRYNANHGTTLPPSFHTFHTNQQQHPHLHAMYQSQIPFQMPVAWPTAANRPAGHVVNNNNNAHVESRRGSKHRARSVDASSRGHPPVRYYNQQQQQPAPMVTEHHHHRHHHHRSHPTNVQIVNTGLPAETGKDQNIPLKETMTTANNATNGEKLTIRQLNEIFVQMDPSGRLPYSSLPNILQRFGIALTETELTSAAQDLNYNTTEPLTARRLVHVLVKLGKIAKSTQQQQQQQQRPAASPMILPEDREVNDIMTQRRVAGTASTHIHSSIYPNQWY